MSGVDAATSATHPATARPAMAAPAMSSTTAITITRVIGDPFLRLRRRFRSRRLIVVPVDLRGGVASCNPEADLRVYLAVPFGPPAPAPPAGPFAPAIPAPP